MAPAVHGATPPANLNVDNGAAITTGVGFHVNATKSIAGVSFYVPTTNTGTYTVGLYQSTSDDSAGTGTGTLLASASVAAGSVTPGTWADVLFTTPVTVNSGQMYRAARHASSGRYVSTAGAFTSAGLTANGITFNQTGTDPVGSGTFRNGMFNENASMAYPNQTFGGADYFVDVVLASSSNDAVVGNSLPALAGSLTGDQQYAATIAGSVPALSGSLTGDQRDDAVIAGSVPALAGLLSGDEQYDAVIAGTVPALTGSLAGDQQYPVIISGNAPALAGVVTGDSLTDAVVSGSLPTLSGVLLVTMDELPLDIVVIGSLPGLSGKLSLDVVLPPVFNVTLELTMQRHLTTAFIAANPTQVTLIPRQRYRTPAGAWKYQKLDPRPAQTMRIIEQGPPEVLTTPDGVQRTLDYVLLAEWDAEVEPNDVFEFDGDTLEVIEVYHDNQYETRAALMRRLDPP